MSPVATTADRLRAAAIGLACLALWAGCTRDVPTRRSLPTSAASGAAASTRPVPDAGGALASPFDVEARRQVAGRPIPAPGPVARISPIRDLRGVSFYVDKNHSVADPEKKRENEAAVAPVRSFVAGVTDLADGWMRSLPARPEYAAAALEELSLWAAAGALLGDVNKQGSYERKWTLGSLALAFLKIRTAPGLDPAKLGQVRDWLSKVASVVIPPYEDLENSTSHNNHAYWAGLAVAAVGVAANDRHLFDWGISRARMGIADVRADGTLPLEMERASLALHYHAFALPPLVLLAEIGVANGFPLYDENNAAIRRLADRVIRGMDDPTDFEKVARQAQDFPLRTHPKPAYFAWAEAYYARFHDPRLLRWLGSGGRPFVDVRLGGDQTLAFGIFPLPLRRDPG